jgi:microcystin-dependent protein
MRKISSLPNSNPDSADYPYGQIKDETTEELGTPVVEATYSDVVQSMHRFVQASGETPNGIADNRTNGWQIVRAIEKVLYPVGTIRIKANVVDSDCLECNGETYDPEVYPELFTEIGYTFGTYEGLPKLPNLLYAFPLGRSTFTDLGDSGGESVVTLGQSQVPYHTHSAPDGKGWLAGYLMTLCEYYEGSASNNDGYGIKNSGGGAVLSSTTNGAFGNVSFGTDAHNNMPPFTTFIFQIKAKYIGDSY